MLHILGGCTHHGGLQLPNKPWVNIYNHIYEDCIVGNSAGLELLKEAIDKALAEGDCQMEDELESDFISIYSTEDVLPEEKQSKTSKFIGIFIMSLLFIWLVALPTLGIYKLWVTM